MRLLKRQKLSNRTLSVLKRRTRKVSDKSNLAGQVEEASRLWKSKKNKAFDEIRSTLHKMAPGIARCMYCEDSAGTDIEHFRPKNTYPLNAFEWDNYLLACSKCNSNNKRTEFPLDDDGNPLLIDPTSEDPRLHIAFSPSTGRYVDLTIKGKESVKVYGLNRGTLTQGRKDAWISIQEHIIRYGDYRNNGNTINALELKEVIRRFPHDGVFVSLIDMLDSPAATQFIEPECIQTIKRYPEIKDWLV